MKKLWEISNELRSQQKLDLLSLIKEAKNNDLCLKYEDLREFSKYFGRTGEIVFPEIITKFIIEILQDNQGSSIMDPSAGLGSLLTLIVKDLSYEKVFGIVQTAEQIEIASLMDKSKEISWEHLMFNDFINTTREPINTVVSCPPFIGMKKEIEVKTADRTIKYKDTLANILILKSLLLLSQDGKGIFIVPQSFFLDQNKKFRTLINGLGFYIQFAITLPSNTFNNTSITTNLILINREKSDNLFIAELNELDDISSIVDNWKRNKQGRIITLGTYVKVNEYKSFRVISKELELNRLAEKMNIPSYPLKEIAYEINRGQRGQEDGFTERPNSVYLPLIGNSKALCKIADFKMTNPQNYIQLVLDSKKALAEFVAHFFNTEFGLTLRESLSNGMTIPKINKSSLESAMLYLPDIDTQHESVKLQSNITDLRSQLNKLEHQLWKHPLKYKQIEKEIQQLNRDDGLQEWIEGLPFPLGSILWRYVAESDIRIKKEILLHFYEAFIQFHVMIILSGLMSDEQCFKENKSSWFTSEDIEYLKRATFGAWIEVGSRIAKVVRRELSNDDPYKKERVQRMFCQGRVEYIEAITNKRIFGILIQAKDIRNQDAHGGIESLKDATNKLTLLESELSKLRGILGSCYEDTYLVRHKSLDYIEEQIFKQNVELLIGSRSPFIKFEIAIKKPLKKDKLYLYNQGYTEALQLIPLVKFMSAPDYEENACYFYNKIEKNRIHWKSYHFDKEAEKIESDNSLIDILNSFID
ncbi:N-6 DNA methylase [Peribacillus frigoritolerans]|uniref:N-6 DNA methylase n=1 Tax=Peribacillus frigoritolerans TaxID=450367 RepID=UPI003D2E54CF